MPIDGFDENEIIIPGDKNKTVYQLKAAVQFYPVDRNNSFSGGHYTCWIPALEHWLEISDSSATHHKTFNRNLKDIYIMFIEKKFMNKKIL